jgi:hypothetical protein
MGTILTLHERPSNHWYLYEVFLMHAMLRYALWSERSSDLFIYLPRNGSERNSELFLFGETDGIPTKWIKISVGFVIRGINFSLKMATLVEDERERGRFKKTTVIKLV